MDNIAPLSAALALASPGGAAPARGGDGFGVALRRALESVNTDQNRADALQRAYQLGDPEVSVEQAMLATQEASLSFQGLVQTRNRLVSAYHDIMNMQV